MQRDSRAGLCCAAVGGRAGPWHGRYSLLATGRQPRCVNLEIPSSVAEVLGSSCGGVPCSSGDMLAVAVCSCLLSMAAAQQEEVSRYLARYGYPAQLELATRQFQQLAGLPATGQSDPATIAQTELARCGAPDQGAGRTGGAGVRTYSVTQYPPPQSPSIDRQHIDTVLATAANLWNKVVLPVYKLRRS